MQGLKKRVLCLWRKTKSCEHTGGTSRGSASAHRMRSREMQVDQWRSVAEYAERVTIAAAIDHGRRYGMLTIGIFASWIIQVSTYFVGGGRQRDAEAIQRSVVISICALMQGLCRWPKTGWLDGFLWWKLPPVPAKSRNWILRLPRFTSCFVMNKHGSGQLFAMTLQDAIGLRDKRIASPLPSPYFPYSIPSPLPSYINSIPSRHEPLYSPVQLCPISRTYIRSISTYRFPPASSIHHARLHVSQPPGY